MYNLTYTLGDPERNNHEFYYDLDLDYLKQEVMEKNKTIWLHTRFISENPLKKDPEQLNIARFQ